MAKLKFQAEAKHVCMLDVCSQELFRDPKFIEWLNDASDIKFTWHQPGDEPNGWSDVLVYYGTGGEGSNSDMPYWDDLCEMWADVFGENREGWIRLLNLETGDGESAESDRAR